jgi:hypothetical protein
MAPLQRARKKQSFESLSQVYSIWSSPSHSGHSFFSTCFFISGKKLAEGLGFFGDQNFVITVLALCGVFTGFASRFTKKGDLIISVCAYRAGSASGYRFNNLKLAHENFLLGINCDSTNINWLEWQVEPFFWL